MKPANYPERVNQRRKDAAARMMLSNRARQTPKANTDQHINETLAKVSYDSRRDVRTKKNRSPHA